MNFKAHIQHIKKNKVLFLMILPAFLYFFIFHYIPMGGIVIAFKRLNYSKGVFASPWVGFENFRFMFIGGKIFKVTFNTVFYNLGFIVINNFLEILFAVMLTEIGGKYYKKISQSIMLLPHFISWVVVGAFVYNIFSFEYGALNNMLKALNMQPVNVYMNVGVWKYIIFAANAWKTVGYRCIIYLAAITSIEQQLYEAAIIDGANILQRITRITIPCLTPQIVILVLLQIGHIFKGNFGLFYQVTGNNPMLYESTDVIDTFVFRSLTTMQDFGMSSAAGVYQAVLGFIIINVVNCLVKAYNREYALY